MVKDHRPIVQLLLCTETKNEGHDDQVIVREQQSILINQESPQLRCSERVIHRPSKYLLYGESFETSIEQEKDLTLYKEAMKDIDVDHWRSVITLEMKSMYTNST